jgi:hypothetical protein
MALGALPAWARAAAFPTSVAILATSWLEAAPSERYPRMNARLRE